MPIEIKDVDGGLGNLIIGSGVVTGEEYVNAIKKHLSQDKEKFKKYRYSISDYTAAVRDEIHTDDIKTIVNFCERAARMNPHAVIAIVADKDFAFGLSRMWEMLMGQAEWEIKVFRSRGDAERYIISKVKELFDINDITFQ